MTRLYEVDGYLGCVQRRANRETGTTICVFQANQAGIEDDPATPWATLCEPHGSCVCHYSLAEAKSHAAAPSGWCEACRLLKSTPVELRATEAFDDNPAEARAMWAAGLRPMEARRLRHGMEVAYVEALFEGRRLEPELREWRTTRIEEVAVEPELGAVLVSTWTAGVIQVDECEEVWAR